MIKLEMMKGVVFSLLGLILLMCACGSSKTKQERGKATVQAEVIRGNCRLFIRERSRRLLR